MENTEITTEETQSPAEALITQKEKKPGRPKGSGAVKQSRKGRQSNPQPQDFEPRKEAPPKQYASLEDLDEMPLKTHEDYIRYNEAVRQRRRVLRKKDVEYMYAPLDLVKTCKVRLTRKKNRGMPININKRLLDKAVWFQSPKGGFKDGEEVELPECLLNWLNGLAVPVYKQEKYPDGSYSTVLDRMDEVYSAQVMLGG